jgi:hypothetical protein
MLSKYDILIDKIDGFIRKYYFNLLMKGFLFFGAGFLILFLFFSVLEYIGYFTSEIRFILFYGFIGFNIYVFIRYVLIPFLGLIKIGRKINEKEAARILGNHFKNELNDKIINALELKEYMDKNDQDSSLLMAGIDQKADLAGKFPFNNAVDMKGNVRFLPFFALPLIIFLGIMILQPTFLVDPAKRIARYQTAYEKPTPFHFTMLNDNTAFKNNDFELVLRADGSIVPDQVSIEIASGTFNTEKIGSHTFRHIVRNVQGSFKFFVLAGGYRFGPYDITSLQKPSFTHFNVHVNAPTYTRLQDDTFMNIGDLNVVEGSVITWDFFTTGSQNISFITDSNYLVNPVTTKDGVFQIQVKANRHFTYKVYAVNDDIGIGDSLIYDVFVRPDQYPGIQVESINDSVLLAHVFHRGIIRDDYGFSRLEFHYSIGTGLDQNADNTYQIVSLDVDKSINNQSFYHHFDIRTLGLGPGNTLEYFFMVYDNDAINGPKSARSREFTYYMPTQEELLANTAKQNEQIKEELSGGIGEVKEARKEIEELRRQMLNSDRVSWEQQESIRELLNKQQEIEQKMEQLSQDKRDNETRSDQFKETQDRIREKQEELQQIFEEVLSDELKELFDKIREELENLDRNQVYDMLSKMEFELKDLENQMDRALELFKQLEMERMLQESIDMLNNLREEQAGLENQSGESDQSNVDENEALAEQQEKLNEDFDTLKDLLEEFREKNDDLSRPKDLDNTQQLEESIKQDMDNASKDLKENKPGDAQQKQQGAGQKMDQLAERLESMQSDMFMEQLAEDSRVLREILENLIKTSFSQEDLLLEIRQVNVSDPRYVQFIQEQRKIQDDLKMIEDSLVALSKRQIQIQSFVTREIADIRMNLDAAIYNLIDRQRAQASSRQQFVMTHINNLALLLNESLQNMQMQMAAASGEGMPQPGQGDPSFQNMRQMQEQLNQMLQQMQQGHQPMPGKAGETPMSGSEALARMAAEQEAIRNQLQKMADQLRKEGFGESQEIIDLQRDMQQTELDIVRKQISRQTLLRQEGILTRLLEHEKAELQREMEERRVGTTANVYDLSNPDSIFEYNKERNRELDMLRSIPAGLTPFYRTMVETYFLNVQE